MLPPDAAEVEQILSETCCEDENHRQDNSSSHHRALLLPHGRNSNGLFWAEVNPLGKTSIEKKRFLSGIARIT